MTSPPPSGLGNSQRLTALDDARFDPRVAQRRALQHRGEHLPGGRDRELDHDAPAEVGLLHELLLVAVLHLVDVAADDAANDLLVEGAADGDLAQLDLGRARIACPVARAATLADCAEVTETDGSIAGPAAARSRADQTQAADAVGLTDLIADEPTEDVLRIAAQRWAVVEDRPHRRPVGDHQPDALVVVLAFQHEQRGGRRQHVRGAVGGLAIAPLEPRAVPQRRQIGRESRRRVSPNRAAIRRGRRVERAPDPHRARRDSP